MFANCENKKKREVEKGEEKNVPNTFVWVIFNCAFEMQVRNNIDKARWVRCFVIEFLIGLWRLEMQSLADITRGFKL